MRLPFSLSPGPVKPRRQVPPYRPISCTGLMTSGSFGTRWSTGGSFPCFTSSASIGASLNFVGHLAGSRISSGPSSLPISWAPSLGGAAVPCARATPGSPTAARLPDRSAASRMNSRRLTPFRFLGITDPPR